MSTWDLSTVQHHVLICNGGSCLKNSGDETTLAIRMKFRSTERSILFIQLGLDVMAAVRTQVLLRCIRKGFGTRK